tara:strand:- start:632 stop:1102 length:471 start_codon:yes stop_codon:yes gene_type:complete
MWQDKLKEIIYILENSNVNEIEINFWGRKFRVVKSPSTVLNNELQKQNAASQPINISSFKDEGVPNSSSDSTEENINIEEILSPMPGTYYSSPSPDDPPFIIKGDKVKKGQVLCIIEAMKIMNEIESEFDGVVSEVKVKNGDPVEYNQKLFSIDPS